MRKEETPMSLKNVADRLGIKYYRIAHAISCGQIPEPKMRIAGRRIFTRKDLQRLAAHFQVELPKDDAVPAKAETAET
jgi:hypothetical protein